MRNIKKLVALLLPLTIVFASTETSAENTHKDFTVYEADGPSVFKLSEAKGKYVALHFLLKTACPYCIRHTHDYATRATEVPDVVHVFLKPDTAEEIQSWSVKLIVKYGQDTSAKIQLPTIYRDPEAQLARLFDIPFGYKFHGQIVHYPALVLIDPAGNEVFRYVGKNNGDRYAFDDFIIKITELKENINQNKKSP